MDEGHIPGLSAAVVSRDKILWSAAYGTSDPQLERVTEIQDLFTHASISKTVASVAIMQLYERGLFSLDDDVSMHVGYMVRNPKHNDTAITMKMLMTHMSSISDNYYNDIYDKYAVKGGRSAPMSRTCPIHPFFTPLVQIQRWQWVTSASSYSPNTPIVCSAVRNPVFTSITRTSEPRWQHAWVSRLPAMPES
jgi:CubicO group peptidase (beta-lactamase class C family)